MSSRTDPVHACLTPDSDEELEEPSRFLQMDILDGVSLSVKKKTECTGFVHVLYVNKNGFMFVICLNKPSLISLTFWNLCKA